MTDLKRCSKCKESKTIANFTKNKHYKDGLNHYCKDCSNINQKKFRVENKDVLSERYRRYNLKSRFCMSVEDYQKLLDTQGGKCAICGKTQCDTGRMLAVDHDHKNGKIRGLLCQACNTGLGKFNDSVELLKAALKYIKD